MIQAIKNFIAKLQNLPKADRLVIFFVIMALVAVIGGYLAFMSTIKTIPKLSESLSALRPTSVDISENSEK